MDDRDFAPVAEDFVKDVLNLLAAGATQDEILEVYLYLEAGDITAAFEYAAVSSDHLVLRSM